MAVTLSKLAGFGMFLSLIIVGAARDLLGSFIPGFSIWVLLDWSLVLTGFFLPRESRSAEAA